MTSRKITLGRIWRFTTKLAVTVGLTSLVTSIGIVIYIEGDGRLSPVLMSALDISGAGMLFGLIVLFVNVNLVIWHEDRT